MKKEAIKTKKLTMTLKRKISDILNDGCCIEGDIETKEGDKIFGAIFEYKELRKKEMKIFALIQEEIAKSEVKHWRFIREHCVIQ